MKELSVTWKVLAIVGIVVILLLRLLSFHPPILK